MKAMLAEARAFLDDNLGRCPKCMRQSFVFMLAALGLAVVTSMVTSSPTLLIAGTVVALGSAGLWLSHMLAYALRSARRKTAPSSFRVSKKSAADIEIQPRRQFIISFARSFALVAAATALPVGSAFAATCPCAAPLKCCWSYAADYYVCAAADAVCCTHARNPWSCPSGHTCLGDSGDCT